MDHGNKTTLAPPAQSTSHTMGRSPLKELPGTPLGPIPESVSSELAARLGQAARSTASEVSEWRLVTGLEDQPLAALQQAAAAAAVGAAVVLHQQTEFAWQLPILALLGMGFLVVGGRLLRSWAAVPPLETGEAASEEQGEEVGDPEVAAPSKPGGTASPRLERTRLTTALLAMAVACFTPLVVTGGWPVLAAGMVGAGLAVVLLNRFLPLALQNPAESAARLGLTTVAVAVVALAQTGTWSADIVVAGLQIGFMACVGGVLVSMRNMARDCESGGKAIVSCRGVPAGRFQVALMCLLPYTMGICWIFAGAWGAALLPLLTLPLAFWIIRDVNLYLPGPVFERFLPRAAALHLGFTMLLTAGLVL